MYIAIFLTGLIISGDPATQAWPSFLGRGATPIAPESIPLTWSPTTNIAWAAKLPGKGQSSPVIWGNQVFVTGIEGSMKDTCHVVALDLASGGELWRKSLPSSQTIRSNYFQSRSASTPAVDAERVYAFFETGNLVALTHAGEIVWQRSLSEDYGPFESNIGLAASPLLVNDTVVLLIDHEGPSYLLAIDRKTGETRWKTDRESRKSYASPGLVTIGGREQIVCSSDGSVDGYDPADGKRLWTFADVGGNTAYTPLPFENGRFLVAASPGMHNEREEKARKSNFCMRVDATPEGFQPKIEWRTEQAMPSFASPMVHRGLAYWVNRAGVVFCFDAQTGAQRYAQRTKQPAWATPVGIGDRLYIFGKDGNTTVLAAGSEYRVLAENQLWDPDKVGSDPFGRERANRDRAGEHSGEHGLNASKTRPDKKDVAKDPAGVKSAAGKPADGASAPRGAETGESRRSPMTEKEREENRARGENRFADPVQYGVAMVNGSIVIRTGEKIYCVRELRSKP